MRRVLGLLLWLGSAFFTFYTARLLAVTGFLQHTRAGGQGAYIGAVVFPALAVALAVGGRRLWRRASNRGDTPVV
jgi:membrane protein implicated in regulation of membrane protease activity